MKFKFPLCLLCLVCVAACVAEEPKNDYAQQPFVMEKVHSHVRFENDGGSRTEVLLRVRVQSEAGVRRWGQLVEGYSSSNERLKTEYLKIIKADGSVVNATPDEQDVTAAVARAFPEYSDYRERHLTVPGLRPGDLLEYKFTRETIHPLIPGNFWVQHYTISDADPSVIVLDEQYEVNVPRQRALKLKAAGKDFHDEGDRRIYRWAGQHLTAVEEKSDARKRRGEVPQPSIQLSTFSDWNEIGHWYAGLERERAVVTPEIRKKAQELTAGKASDREKIAALYSFVAQDVRYVSISFGLGRYQPHAAAEVLRNQYGDCKDKHALLAALLEAAGYQAQTVLIHTGTKLDAEVPSPAQFNHVITRVPVGDGAVWLDTTTEVAPYGLLLYPLRDKQALVISSDGATKLMQTPAEPSVPNQQSVEVEGKVDDFGNLTAHVKQSATGDSAVLSRQVIRHWPEAEWKKSIQANAKKNGFGGEVSDIRVVNDTAVNEPLVLEYTATQPKFVDWSRAQSQVVVPFFRGGVPEANGEGPIKIGPAGTVSTRLRIAFPPRYKVQAPAPVTVKRDYADYSSEYRMEGNTLVMSRVVSTRVNEVPESKATEYASLYRAIAGDLAQTLSISTDATSAPAVTAGMKTDDLLRAGLDAQRSGKLDDAVTLYERALAADPKQKKVRDNLGALYISLGRDDDAARVLREQIALDAFDPYAYNNLGRVLRHQHKFDDAIAMFQKQLEVSPLDKYAHGNLGLTYLDLKKYAQAVAEFEAAVPARPNDAPLQVSLGAAYLGAGDHAKAMAAFDKAVQFSATPPIWNGIAYHLALNNTELDRAQQYAESAIAATAAMLRNVSAEHLAKREEDLTRGLAASWDTLGWVYFKRGDLERAERFVTAAWDVLLAGDAADHLAQISEKRGQKDQAAHYEALAIASGSRDEDVHARLKTFAASGASPDAIIGQAALDLKALRTRKLGKLSTEEAKADFYVVSAPGTTGGEVKFAGGSERLAPYADKLRAAAGDIHFPESTPTHIVRRGTLSCSPTEECSFIFAARLPQP